MTTLVGDSTCADQWMRGLRDGDTGLWSRPVASQQLDEAYAAAHGPPPGSPGLRDASARIKRVASIKGQAVETEGDLKAVELCQKPSALRTQEDIKFIQSYMCSLSYFFSLWPAPLQWELCRLLSAHILARREVALTRGKPPDRLYFVVQGRLDVRLPVPSPGGGREERTLAVLTRGNTAGESILLGAQTQHTTVVVSSSSAMLLSLSQPDFSRAFKEVLDIRQAERLTFLRMHPLLAEVPLTDLEAASEVLGLAFHPPGTRLWPLDEPDRCLYFLAEGEAKVKRMGGPAAAAAATVAAAAASGDPDAVALGPSTYDSHTVSVLGPGDIFGLPSSDQALALQLQQACGTATAATVTNHGQLPTANGAALPHEHSHAAGAAGAHHLGPSASVATLGSVAGGERSQMYGSTVGGGAAGSAGGGLGTAAGAATANVVIESFTQVKVYFVKYADYPRLPAVVQRLLQAANSFRWSYYEGRMYGLSKMDNRRHNAQRNAAIRKHNNAAHQRRGGGAGGAGDPLSKPALVAALDAAERDRQLLARLPILCMGMAQAAGAGHHAADAGRPAHGAAPAVVHAPDQHQRWQAPRGHDEPGGDRATGGRRNSSGLPSWAFPPPGSEGNGDTVSSTGTGAAVATAAAAAPGAGRTGAANSGRGTQGQGQGLTQQGTMSGSSVAAGVSSLSMDRRPGSADTASTRCPTASVLGTGTAAGRRGSGGAGHGAGAGSMGGALNPVLQRNKALLAVQAQQLAHVLVSERQQYGQRFAVLHPELARAGGRGGAEGEEDAEGWWDGEEEEEEGGEYEGSVDDGDGSGSRYGLRESARGRVQGFTRGLHSRGAGGQGGDVSYRRSLSPPKATLGLLPPGQSAFPRVGANTGKRHSVETEQPRSLSAPQSIHARHLALFQRARAQAQADAAARPWDRAARAQRPTFGRPTDSNGYPTNDGGSPTFAGGLLPLPGSRFGSPSSYDPASGLLLPMQRTPSGRPQRPDDRLSRYGSTGRTSSAGGVRPGGSGTDSSTDGTAGGGAGGADVAPGGLLSPKLARGGAAAGPAASPGRGVGGGGVWRGSGLVPMSPELSFSNLGVKDVEGEDDSSEDGELDLLYTNMDDDALLARVPARLLGKGAAAGTPGAGGAEGQAAEKAAGGGGEARGPSRVVELPLGFDPLALPAPSAGFRQPAAAAAAPAGSGVGASGVGAGTAGSGGAGVRQPAPGAAASAALAATSAAASSGSVGGVAGSGRSGGTMPQGAGAGPAEADGAGAVGSGPAASAGGGLNFTMRRKGAAGPGAAPGLGSGVGPGAGAGASAASPRMAAGGSGVGAALQSGLAAGGGTGVGRQGGVGSGVAAGPARNGPTVATNGKGSGGVARMLDALYPQDLDQSLTQQQHHHHHHGAAGATSGPHLGAASISPSPPAGGRNAPGTPPPSAQHPGPTHASSSSSSSQSVPPLQQQQQQPQQQPQAPVGQAPVAPQGLGLPPGIALGYESLDPFQWAALSAQVGPGMIKTPFTQDNILPKPQW